MFFSQETFVDPQPLRKTSTAGISSQISLASLWSTLHPFGRKALNLPGLRVLRPVARRAMAVAEPVGRLSIRNFPAEIVQSTCAGITVLSANLWHDWPLHRRLVERLENFAWLVQTQKADIVLLQEVARTRDLWVDEWLSERLNMSYIYSRVNGNRAGIGFEEGLAVFSRFSLSTAYLQQLGLETNPFVRRLALGATVETPCGRVLTLSVHLGLPRKQNFAQLAHLRSWVTTIAGDLPVLVGGDFNADEKSSQILRTKPCWLDTFRQMHPTADGTTHTLRWPWGGQLLNRRLDYIFFRPGKDAWKVQDARHLETPGDPHSDHRAVLARLVPVSNE